MSLPSSSSSSTSNRRSRPSPSASIPIPTCPIEQPPPSNPNSSATSTTPATPPSAPRRNSRKHRQLVVPADTVLSFSHYTPSASSSTDVQPRQKRTPQKHPARSRDSFVQANYRFVVDHSTLAHPSPVSSHHDVPIPWDAFHLVFLPSIPSCPISLQPPRIPRLTPCGHVFDAISIAQHFAHAHAANRPAKCPLCADRLSPDLLKPCASPLSLQNTESQPEEHKPASTQPPPLRLIARNRGSTIAHARVGSLHIEDKPPVLEQRDSFFARYAFATNKFLLTEIDHEQAELSQILFEEPELAPFIAVTRAELDTRRVAVLSRPPIPASPVAVCEPGNSHDAQSAPASNSAPLSGQTDESNNGNFSGGDSPSQEKPVSVPHSQRPPRRRGTRWLYYQSNNGENIFLHPATHRVLSTEFGSDLNGAPPELKDLPLLQQDRLTMDDTLRKRYRFLDHLGDGCEFSFIELDVSTVVSPRALAAHEAELRERRDARRKKKAASAKETRLVKRRETEALQEHASLLRGARNRPGENIMYSRDVHSFPALREPSASSSTGAAEAMPSETDVSASDNCPSEAQQLAASPNSGGRASVEFQDDGFAGGSGGLGLSSSPSGRWGAAVSSYSSVTSNMGLFPALGDVTSREAGVATGSSLSPPKATSSNASALRGVWRPAGAAGAEPIENGFGADGGASTRGEGYSATSGGDGDTRSRRFNAGVDGTDARDGASRVTEATGESTSSSTLSGRREEGGRKGRKSRGKSKSTTILLSNAGTPHHRP